MKRIPYWIFSIIMLWTAMTFTILNIDRVFIYQIILLCLNGGLICFIQDLYDEAKRREIKIWS